MDLINLHVSFGSEGFWGRYLAKSFVSAGLGMVGGSGGGGGWLGQIFGTPCRMLPQNSLNWSCYHGRQSSVDKAFFIPHSSWQLARVYLNKKWLKILYCGIKYKTKPRMVCQWVRLPTCDESPERLLGQRCCGCHYPWQLMTTNDNDNLDIYISSSTGRLCQL